MALLMPAIRFSLPEASGAAVYTSNDARDSEDFTATMAKTASFGMLARP